MANPDSNTLGARIRAVRDELSLSRERFAQEMGVHKNTIIRYESGERVPDADFLSAMCERWRDIDSAWLLTGKRERQVGAVAEQASNYSGSDIAAHDLVRMTPGRVQASSGLVVSSDQVTDELAFSRAWLVNELGIDPGQVALIRARGDSMAQTIRDGDLMVLDLGAQDAETEGVYVLHLDRVLVAKRLQRLYDGSIRVTSDNAAYQEQVVPPDRAEVLSIIGRVVWTGRHL
jgi:phage repressor protein C with HTH and peptisase S24 domain/DNA-binding XRE family transcriptional regulator